MVQGLVQDVGKCAAIVDELLQQAEVAVDMEGVELCREGEICLVQIADEAGRVFLLDITRMGHAAFQQGRLGELFSDAHVSKVVCDGRADNDALLHLHGVVMQNVYDLQVLHALKFSQNSDLYVKGLEKCLEAAAVVPLPQWQRMLAIKRRGKELFAPDLGGSLDVWRQRPLRRELVAYAVADVECILAAKQKWATPSLNPLVQRLAEERIHRAIAAPQTPRGPHMAIRDFPLSGGEAVDGPLTKRRACFSFCNTGRCRFGYACLYSHAEAPQKDEAVQGPPPRRYAYADSTDCPDSDDDRIEDLDGSDSGDAPSAAQLPRAKCP